MRRLTSKLTALLALILAIDLSLSHVLEYGRPVDYAQFVDSKKVYDQLPSVDVLFVGDSQTADGFVPSVFRQRLGATAFNYGVYQLSPFEGYYLLKDLVARHERPPRLVVLGTDVQMFHYPMSDGKYSSLFIENPANLLSMLVRTQNLGALTAAGRKKFLFGGLVKSVMHREVHPELRRQVRSIDNGYLLNEKHFSDAGELDHNKDRDFFSATVVERQREYYFKTMALLKARGIPVVIANLPMHRRFLAGMRASATYRAFRGVLAEIGATCDVDIFNERHDVLLADLTDEDFLDGDHLCYPGAVKFSSRFADFLAAKGFRFDKSSESTDRPAGAGEATPRVSAAPLQAKLDRAHP
jgi:hypothetical protein